MEEAKFEETKNEGQKVCSACGAPLKEGDEFCANCGQKVNAEPVKATGSNKVHPAFNYGSSNKAVGSLVCGILSIFIAGFILGVVAICLGKDEKDCDSKAKAGFILGIIGIIGGVLSIIAVILSVVLASNGAQAI